MPSSTEVIFIFPPVIFKESFAFMPSDEFALTVRSPFPFITRSSFEQIAAADSSPSFSSLYTLPSVKTFSVPSAREITVFAD